LRGLADYTVCIYTVYKTFCSEKLVPTSRKYFYRPSENLLSVDSVEIVNLVGFGRHNTVFEGCWWRWGAICRTVEDGEQ